MIFLKFPTFENVRKFAIIANFQIAHFRNSKTFYCIAFVQGQFQFILNKHTCKTYVIPPKKKNLENKKIKQNKKKKEKQSMFLFDIPLGQKGKECTKKREKKSNRENNAKKKIFF